MHSQDTRERGILKNEFHSERLMKYFWKPSLEKINDMSDSRFYKTAQESLPREDPQFDGDTTDLDKGAEDCFMLIEPLRERGSLSD